MRMETKLELLDRLLKELKEGRNEEEIRKELNEYYSSEKKKTPSNIKDSNPLDDERNPLVLYAEENGAFRALIKSIRTDLNSDDVLSKTMIPQYLERMKSLELHYKKMDELFMPYLKRLLPIEKTEGIKNEQDCLLSFLSNEKVTAKEGRLSPDEISSFLAKLEERIIDENRFLLPLLEDNLCQEELDYLYLEECRIGFALLRIK